jgi:hypothetical protein
MINSSCESKKDEYHDNKNTGVSAMASRRTLVEADIFNGDIPNNK